MGKLSNIIPVSDLRQDAAKLLKQLRNLIPGLILPLCAVPKEDLRRTQGDIDVKIKPAVVNWEGMTFISATMAQAISPDNAVDYAMVEKIIKEKLGEKVDN